MQPPRVWTGPPAGVVTMPGSPSSPWPPPWSPPWPAGNWRHEDQYEQLFINTLGAWMERILSNDTETKSEVSQGKMLLSIPSISHHEPTIWLLQCCRFPTCCCKLQNVWTEHYWMRTKGECGFAELGAWCRPCNDLKLKQIYPEQCNRLGDHLQKGLYKFLSTLFTY